MTRLPVLVALAVVSVAASARADDLAAAKAHYQKATTAFDLGDYKAAVAEYRASYTSAPLPGTLFALGQSERLSGDLEAAGHSYERYIEISPSGKFTADARRFLGECKAALAHREQARASPPQSVPRVEFRDTSPSPPESAPAPTTPPPRRRALIVGLTTGAGLVIVAAVAIGLGVGLSAGSPPSPNASLGTMTVAW